MRLLSSTWIHWIGWPLTVPWSTAASASDSSIPCTPLAAAEEEQWAHEEGDGGEPEHDDEDLAPGRGRLVLRAEGVTLGGAGRVLPVLFQGASFRSPPLRHRPARG